MGDDSITQKGEEELEGTYCSQVVLLTMIAIRGIWLCNFKCKLFKNKENFKIKCLPVTCQILNIYIYLVVGALSRVENICIAAENYEIVLSPEKGRGLHIFGCVIAISGKTSTFSHYCIYSFIFPFHIPNFSLNIFGRKSRKVLW